MYYECTLYMEHGTWNMQEIDGNFPAVELERTNCLTLSIDLSNVTSCVLSCETEK